MGRKRRLENVPRRSTRPRRRPLRRLPAHGLWRHRGVDRSDGSLRGERGEEVPGELSRRLSGARYLPNSGGEVRPRPSVFSRLEGHPDTRRDFVAVEGAHTKVSREREWRRT